MDLTNRSYKQKCYIAYTFPAVLLTANFEKALRHIAMMQLKPFKPLLLGQIGFAEALNSPL